MADFEDNGISVDDWMNQQPVNCCQCIRACCSSKRVRRRYARQRLPVFKRLTVEELDRRYQKHKSRLRSEEDQAVSQVIDKFKKGSYIEIQAVHWIGTFYSPVSPLFTVFFYLVMVAPMLFMPFTYTIYKALCKKDNPTICTTISMLPFFPLFYAAELLSMFGMLYMLVFLLLVLPALELLVFLGGICYYQFGRLQKCGVFVYHCKLRLITVPGLGTKTHGNVSFDNGAKLVLHHASLCRTTFCNPITAIFKNIKLDDYSYGDVQGLYLSAREVEVYDLHQQQSAALWSQAQSLA